MHRDIQSFICLLLLLSACSARPQSQQVSSEHADTAPNATSTTDEEEKPSQPMAEGQVNHPQQTAESEGAPSDQTVQEPATVTGTEPPPTNPPLQQIRFSEHYPPDEAIALTAWKKQHRAQGPNFEQTCWDLGERVGVPAAPGLLCTVHVTKPELTLARIYRLEGVQLREVFQAVIATYANWLELTPLLEAEGQTLVLHDRTPRSCEGALSEYHAKLDARKPPPAGELLEPACKMRGRYVYERGRYRLVEPVPPRTFDFRPY